MTTTAKLIKHSQHIVSVQSDGTAILIDPVTGRWQQHTSQRQAKWWASVRSRVEHGFGHTLADDTVCQTYINRHAPKAQKEQA